jgi:O-antigen ligase
MGRAAWAWYLLAASALVPLLVPVGPMQLAWIDGLNVLAIVVFLLSRVRSGIVPGRIPLLLPVFVISLGSLLAVTNTRSVSGSALALMQDCYLYTWFLMLVVLLSGPDRLRFVGRAFIVTAVVTALVSVGMLLVRDHVALGDLIGPNGARATGTFPNPNYLADYLVLSFFLLLGGLGIHGVLAAGAGVVLLIGLLATKSNGAMISLLVGLVAWVALRAYSKRVRPMVIAGAAALSLATIVAGWALVAEWGVGSSTWSEIRSRSFAGRLERSSDDRLRIWSQLQSAYATSPLGIGPGSSRSATQAIDTQQRPGRSQAKEAHNDYLGYAIERGPIALAGLLALLAVCFRRSTSYLKRVSRGEHPSAWEGAFAAAIVAGLVASCVHSLVIEKLHFRHFWFYLAILYAGTPSPSRRTAMAPERKGAPMVHDGSRERQRWARSSTSMHEAPSASTGAR